MIRPFVLVLLFGARLAIAGDVYVWTDEDGRRQISDVVPEKYRTRAKKVDVPDVPAVPAEDLRPAASGGSAPPEIVAPPEEPPLPEPGISSK